MLKIIKEQKGSMLVVRLSGVLVDDINLESLIGPPPKELTIICAEISRVNSVGVKAWIKYFEKVRTKGTILFFRECSTNMVEQFNNYVNFRANGIIQSIHVPFACNSCDSQFVELYKIEQLEASGLQIADRTCPKCAQTASFDDLPLEYFRFMKK